MPKILCPDQVKTGRLDPHRVDQGEFNYILMPWFRLFDEARQEQGQAASMNALICLWIPFNAWLAQTIEKSEQSENDARLVEAASHDTALMARFDQLLAADATFTNTVTEFQSCWPIFKVRWLVEKGIDPWGVARDDRGQYLDRASYRSLCFSKNPKPEHYRPSCYQEHQDGSAALGGAPHKVPLNWPHTLSAIYQIRCSLFHGGKTYQNSKDVELSQFAHAILWRVWGELYLKP